MQNKKLRRHDRGPLKGVVTICALLAAVFIGMCVCSESFRSVYNITNMLTQCVPLACIALGQTLIIVSGGIDLSVGSAISVSTAVAAKLLDTDNAGMVALGVAAVLLTGAAIGFLNGCGINFLRVPPLITTLCMSTILRGVALWILPIAGGKINKGFAKFIYQKWDILSMPLIIIAVFYLLMRLVLYRTRTGTAIYAIGRSRRIARGMGVSDKWVSLRAYVLCGVAAALTGLLLSCRMRVGDPTCGTPYSMDSITAAVIGGTSMAGGVGLLSGSLAGAFLIGMLSNIMNNLAINQFLQYVVKGSLLIVAMVIYSLSAMLEVKRREK